MRGGAQSDLVLTDAGWYVVKWKQNPQHRRVLINEVIALGLLRLLGIAAPDWAIVHAGRRFLRDNPEARIALKNSFLSVQPGLHFGSRVPVDPAHRAVYDFLPEPVLKRIDNLSDFMKVFVFDHWVDNSDRRQAIFFRSSARNLSAMMIDNGHILGFNGLDWDITDRRIGHAWPLISELYLSRQANDQFAATVAQIESLSLADYEAVRQSIPAEWMENDEAAVAELFDRLRRRARRLRPTLDLALAEMHAHPKNEAA
jgi:hypothetical protein